MLRLQTIDHYYVLRVSLPTKGKDNKETVIQVVHNQDLPRKRCTT